MNLQGSVSDHFQMQEFVGVSWIHQKAQYIKEWHYVPKVLCVPASCCSDMDPVQVHLRGIWALNLWEASSFPGRTSTNPTDSIYTTHQEHLIQMCFFQSISLYIQGRWPAWTIFKYIYINLNANTSYEVKRYSTIPKLWYFALKRRKQNTK